MKPKNLNELEIYRIHNGEFYRCSEVKTLIQDKINEFHFTIKECGGSCKHCEGLKEGIIFLSSLLGDKED